MIRVFLHAQNYGLELSPPLRMFTNRRLKHVDRSFQHSEEARQTFQTILSRKGQVGRILRMMHEVGFLGRYIPEFGDLTCLVQHEFYHRYTADEHTLKVVEALDELIDTDNPKLAGYRELFTQLEDPFVLYLAILLHDTGRAANARHHEDVSTMNAQKVAKRLKLNRSQRRELLTLVDHHTSLSKTAQHRNIDDPATVEEFSTMINDQKSLDSLMLLTLADGQGTTDEQTWSDWKESLVWRLYRETKGFLSEGQEFYNQQLVHREDLLQEVSKKLSPTYEAEILAHFSSMPEVYFRTFQIKDIISHIRMFRKLLARWSKPDPELSLKPIVQWDHFPAQGHSRVLISTLDREGLLERIAGSFAVANLNILSADVYTRDDSLGLDVFRVCTSDLSPVTDDRDITLVNEILMASLTQDDFEFTPFLEKAREKQRYHLSDELQFPTKITISNETHPEFTVVELQMPDRIGLLHDLLVGFSSVNINIVYSRISSEKGGVIDNFYITDYNGNKVTSDDDILQLQNAIKDVAASANS